MTLPSEFDSPNEHSKKKNSFKEKEIPEETQPLPPSVLESSEPEKVVLDLGNGFQMTVRTKVIQGGDPTKTNEQNLKDAREALKKLMDSENS